MQEGIDIRCAQPLTAWPLDEQLLFGRVVPGGPLVRDCAVFAKPGGNFWVMLDLASKDSRLWETPLIQFTGVDPDKNHPFAVRFRFSYTSGGAVHCEINEHPLTLLPLSLSDLKISGRTVSEPKSGAGTVAPVTIPVEPVELDKSLASYDNPDAVTVCQNWMTARKDSSPLWNKVKPGFVARTDDNILSDFSTDLSVLKDFRDKLRAGDTRYISQVASKLRSLVSWKDLSPSYTPLLLRLAEKKDLPLPVYVNSPKPLFDEHEFAGRTVINTSAVKGFRAGVYPLVPGTKLVDFQDVLSEKYFTDTLFPEGGSAAGEGRTVQMSGGDLIIEYANAYGGSHSSAATTVGLERVRSQHADYLSFTFTMLADCVLDLGNWILAHWGRPPAFEVAEEPVKGETVEGEQT